VLVCDLVEVSFELYAQMSWLLGLILSIHYFVISDKTAQFKQCLGYRAAQLRQWFTVLSLVLELHS